MRKEPALGHSTVGNTTFAALHPEVEGLNPEDYPDINKLGILADIAPCFREYNRIRAVVDKQANGNPELRAHYEQIVTRSVRPRSLPSRSTSAASTHRSTRSKAPSRRPRSTASSSLSTQVASSTSVLSAARWPISWPINWASQTR
jgi:hypothetical protein